MRALVTAGIGAGIGAVVCLVLARLSLRHPPTELIRANVDGNPVPAVLGYAVVGGALAGLAVSSWVARGFDLPVAGTLVFDAEIYSDGVPLHGIGLAVGVVIVGFYLAGAWDDRRGDERPRGFAGHLAAIRGGRMTGGLVKLIVGGAVALGAAALVRDDWEHVIDLVLIGAVIALTANLVNLFDRAPGRAAKVFLVAALPIAVLGDPAWLVAAAGTIGALLAALPFDLRARAMLGDAGSNPLGAVLGVGLTSNFSGPPGALGALAAMVVALLAVNLASERWSFSEVIARNRWLARLDQLGRK